MYSFSLSKKLPLGDFQWLTATEVETFDVMQMNPDGLIGFILKVDLEYPPEIHNKTNELPLAPEKISIPPAMWSPYMNDIAAAVGIDPKVGHEKLIPHLGPRKHYVVHYLLLQYYLEMGLKLKKS